MQDITEIIENTNDDNFDSNIEEILSVSGIYIRTVIYRLQRYINRLKLSNPRLDYDKALPYNIELYTTMWEIINLTNTDRYKDAMDILHLYFYRYREDAYKPMWILRYPLPKQKFTRKQIYTFKSLIEIFNYMSIKDNSISGLDIKRLLKKDFIILSDIVVDNLLAYYRNR